MGIADERDRRQGQRRARESGDVDLQASHIERCIMLSGVEGEIRRQDVEVAQRRTLGECTCSQERECCLSFEVATS